MIMVVGFRVWLGVTFCVDSPLRAATSSREDYLCLTLEAFLGLSHDSVLPGAGSLSVENTLLETSRPVFQYRYNGRLEIL